MKKEINVATTKIVSLRLYFVHSFHFTDPAFLMCHQGGLCCLHSFHLLVSLHLYIAPTPTYWKRWRMRKIKVRCLISWILEGSAHQHFHNTVFKYYILNFQANVQEKAVSYGYKAAVLYQPIRNPSLSDIEDLSWPLVSHPNTGVRQRCKMV